MMDCGTVNLSRRSPKNKSSWQRRFFDVEEHGGVLRITQKGLYVRTTIVMAPFHHLPIDACTGSNACIRNVGGNLLRCGPGGLWTIGATWSINRFCQPMTFFAPPWKAALPSNFESAPSCLEAAAPGMRLLLSCSQK